eukprot:TRINITY_DN4277_c0_g1_i4.p1 TRINITY_DN4277_c0_g1~~TRINITY_DN4277_c0_g1_i4.p1  ORF type:complete len:640 (+),score=47.22 TRINITY_DN4277_c0_g1_i4:121-1920(+)
MAPPVTPAPGTPSPDTSAPATSSPPTSAPFRNGDVDSPPTAVPSSSSGGVAFPVTLLPSTPAPDTITPDTVAPSTAVPATSVPATRPTSTPDAPAPAPDMTAGPDTGMPATSVPQSAPSTPIPSTPTPGTSAMPATLSPVSSAPATVSPSSASPSTLIPAAVGIPSGSPSPSVSSTPVPLTGAPPGMVSSAPVPSTPNPLTPGVPPVDPKELTPMPGVVGTPSPPPPSSKQVDECADSCALCPLAVCGSAGQACADPSFSTADDWYCKCPAPAVGEAIGALADCTLDECAAGSAGFTVCAAAGQACLDDDVGAAALGGWACECASPARGRAVAAAAACKVDECGVELCPPQVVELREAVIHGVASAPAGSDEDCKRLCAVTDDCFVYSFSAVSPNSGFPDAGSCTVGEGCCFMKARIEAPPPPLGDAGCGNRTCGQAGQACYDPNHDETAQGDWQCLCPPPLAGAAVAWMADCGLDECLGGGIVACIALNETCVDPNMTTASTMDWYCTEGINECVEECETCANATCSVANQMCIDPSPAFADLGDWMCRCTSNGAEAVGQPASCNRVGGASESAASTQVPHSVLSFVACVLAVAALLQ